MTATMHIIQFSRSGVHINTRKNVWRTFHPTTDSYIRLLTVLKNTGIQPTNTGYSFVFCIGPYK